MAFLRRPRWRTALLAGSATVMLWACAFQPAPARPADAPAITVGGVEIRNELPYPVTDVMIRIPATGGFAGCGNIPPRSRCVNRFENFDYRDHEVTISWSERGQAHQTGEFRIELPEQAAPEAVYRLQVVVFAPGEAGAQMVRDSEAAATPR